MKTDFSLRILAMQVSAGAALMAMAITGCSNTAAKAYEEGWREAFVLRQVAADEPLDNLVKDCRAEPAGSDAQVASH